MPGSLIVSLSSHPLSCLVVSGIMAWSSSGCLIRASSSGEYSREALILASKDMGDLPRTRSSILHAASYLSLSLFMPVMVSPITAIAAGRVWVMDLITSSLVFDLRLRPDLPFTPLIFKYTRSL